MSDSYLKPSPEDTRVFIPVSFETKGTARQKGRSSTLMAVGVGIFTLVVVYLILKSGFSLKSIVWAAIVLVAGQYVIRFPILKEHIYRKSLAQQISNDYIVDPSTFWGIVDVDENYPYFARYKSGMISLFVHFEHDVKVGKGYDALYNHYEGVSNALNRAADMGFTIIQIDLMDSIGADYRLENYIKDISISPNPDIRDLLQTIASSHREEMADSVSSNDYYVFVGKGNEKQFYSAVIEVCNSMLEANYISYDILTPEGIRKLAKSLFNVHDFSLVDTARKAFTSSVKFINPISLQSGESGEVVILGLTQEQKQEELKKKNEKAKGAKAASKTNKGGSSSEIELDIF